jgi:hypothetical protein
VQLPILNRPYIGLRKVIDDPEQILDFSYPALHNLSWMKELEKNIHQFDNTLFGVVDLTKKPSGRLYWPALILPLPAALCSISKASS